MPVEFLTSEQEAIRNECTLYNLLIYLFGGIGKTTYSASTN